jgi:hypothetical protein
MLRKVNPVSPLICNLSKVAAFVDPAEDWLEMKQACDGDVRVFRNDRQKKFLMTVQGYSSRAEYTAAEHHRLMALRPEYYKPYVALVVTDYGDEPSVTLYQGDDYLFDKEGQRDQEVAEPF